MKRVDEGCRELEPFLAPFPVRDCGVRFAGTKTPVAVLVTVGLPAARITTARTGGREIRVRVTAP
jgi:hypothetical protein